MQKVMLELADCCKPARSDPSNGWTIDAWGLSEDAVGHLVKAYRESFSPTLESRINERLNKAGIDLNKLLFDSTTITKPQHEKVVRADLTEFAAAASLIAVEGIQADYTCLANLSKGSRKKSDSGIDVVAIKPHGEAADLSNEADYLLILCSVKHTTKKASNMRGKLVASVTDDLSIPYLSTQFVVIYKEYSKAGIDLESIFEKLIDYPRPGSVFIIAAGAVDTNEGENLADQMKHLPMRAGDTYHCRHLLLADIANLHAKVI